MTTSNDPTSQALLENSKVITTASDDLNPQTLADTSEVEFPTLTFESLSIESLTPSTARRNVKKSYIEKYAAEVVGCGYLRLSCQIIDRFNRFGSADNITPTKLEVDAKYVRMLETMVQKQIREIIAGTEKTATNVLLNGLMRSREVGLREKDSEAALKVWTSFENECLRESACGSLSRSGSYGGSFRSISNDSWNVDKDSVAKEHSDQEKGQDEGRGKFNKLVQKPKDSDNLIVRRRRSSTSKRSPLSTVHQRSPDLRKVEGFQDASEG